MKSFLMTFAVVAAICAAVVTPCSAKIRVIKGDTKTLDTMSYCMGVVSGLIFKEGGASEYPIDEFSASDMIRGIKEVFSEKQKMKSEEVDAKMNEILEAAYNNSVGVIMKKGVDSPKAGKLHVSKADSKKFSYYIGVALANQILVQEYEGKDETLQYHWYCEALDDVLVKDKVKISMQDVNAFLDKCEVEEHTAPQKPTNDDATAKLDSVSYSLGVTIAAQMKLNNTDHSYDMEVVYMALADTFAGKATLSQEKSVEVLSEYYTNLLSARREEHKEALKSNPAATFNPYSGQEERAMISYAIGVDAASNIIKGKVHVNYYWFLVGFDEYCKEKARFSVEQMNSCLENYFKVVLPAQNAERSAKWLAQKESEEGVKKTASGLLYKIIVKGDMSKAAKNDEDVVKVHYTGRFQDGSVFDTSRFEDYAKEEQVKIRKNNPDLFDADGNILKNVPFEFPLNRVIKGWTEGMKLIGPGGKIVLYLPAELAYGDKGAGSQIGANEALEFEVELLDVIPAKK